MAGEIFNTERQKKVHARQTCTAKIYMPTVKINLPRAFGQCYVLALQKTEILYLHVLVQSENKLLLLLPQLHTTLHSSGDQNTGDIWTYSSYNYTDDSQYRTWWQQLAN